MEPHESNSEEASERIGPLTLGSAIRSAHGAECHEATTHDQRAAIVWRWPAHELVDLSVPAFAQLIDTLQDATMAGIARVVHGSVATDSAVIAFARPSGRSLRDYLLRGKTSPIEAITSALTLLDALAGLRTLGLRGAWWTPDSLWAMDDEAQWTLAAPGLVSALKSRQGDSLGEIAFRAPEALTLDDMATLSEADYQALEAYAVGATLFYALCQRLPFQADTPEDYLAAQQSSPPPRIDRVDDQLLAHKSLANTIVQCLALNPSERPSSLEALRRLLEEAEREARFQDSRVDFLPARVSETHEMSRPIRGDERDKPSEEVRSSVLPLLALVALIAIALFLIGR